MTTTRFLRTAAFALNALVLLAAANAAGQADLVLYNGTIHTEDDARSIVQAVAIKDGRFIYAGSDSGAAPYLTGAGRTIDLQGRMALPGFIETHAHPTMSLLIQSGVLVRGKNVEAYVQKIRAYRASHRKLPYVVGMGWDNCNAPLTGLTSKELDEAVRGVPAYIFSSDGHSVWLNTRAMRQLGFSRMKTDPQGGRLERDPKTRRPLGTIREWGAEHRVFEALTPPNAEQLKAGLKRLLANFNATGITTVHDAALMPGPVMEALEELAQRGELTMRVRGALYALPVEAENVDPQIAAFVIERGKHTNELFKIDAVKVLVDGVIEGRTAWLKSPYLRGKPQQSGLPMWKQEALNRLVHAAHQAGFQVHFHAIGDKATSAALDALAYSAERGGGSHRDLITHLQLVDPEDIKRFAALNVIAAPQPQWAVKDDYFGTLEVPFLGHARARHQYPIKSFVDAGVLMASSSDYPASVDPSPLLGIQGGVARWLPSPGQTPRPFWVEQRVNLQVMLDSFTRNGAFANFLEHETGTIEVGKAADLVVLNEDLTTIRPEEIYRAKAVLTLLRGVIVSEGEVPPSLPPEAFIPL